MVLHASIEHKLHHETVRFCRLKDTKPLLVHDDGGWHSPIRVLFDIYGQKAVQAESYFEFYVPRRNMLSSEYNDDTHYQFEDKEARDKNFPSDIIKRSS